MFLLHPSVVIVFTSFLFRSHPWQKTKTKRQASTPTIAAASDPDFNVICLGEFLVDMVACQKNTPLSEVTTWEAAPGGAPANVAVALQRLGKCSTSFVGCVGQDPFGDKLRDTLSTESVDTSHLQVTGDDIRTTLGFAGVWDDGRKDNCFYRGADRQLLAENITPDLFETASCLHFGSITLIDEPGATAQRKAMEMARQVGTTMLTYDPNYRQTLWSDKETAHQVMFDTFRYAHMAKISDEEFADVTGHENVEEGIRAILDQGVDLVIVSRGPDGALAATDNFCIESPALTGLDIVETTGAGDAFMAAMITKLLPEFIRLGGSLKMIDRSTVQAALDYANVVAGLACTKAGAIPALPTADQVDEFLASSLSKLRGGGSDSDTDSTPPPPLSSSRLAKMIDHTFLKPYCEEDGDGDVERLCKEARDYGFASVAVNPSQIQTCCRLLQGTGVRVCGAVAFPLGQTTSTVKAYEIRDAIQLGATEVDMVINVRELQKGNYNYVRDEIATLVQICQDENNKNKGERVVCKVILETAYLSRSDMVQACKLCRDAGVDFVKTSTGFAPTGATAEDVRLMRETVRDRLGVKASGGIRDLATARAMIEAGANRLGTSSGVAIIEELLNEEAEPS